MIESFFDLHAWQEGHKLVLAVYKLLADFPKYENYGLSDQIRRCSVSITSNIAEGFSRRSKNEKLQFYSMSLGSLTELQNQLTIARDVGYLDREIYNSLLSQTTVVQKLLHGLSKTTFSHNT